MALGSVTVVKIIEDDGFEFVKQLNFEVQKMILVYLNDDIDIQEVQ